MTTATLDRRALVIAGVVPPRPVPALRVAIIDRDWEGADVLARLARIPGKAATYFRYLVSRADPEGRLWDHAQQAADYFSVHVLTITRWRRILEAVGLLVRTGGGYRGRSVEMTVFRSLSDGARHTADKARAAIWRSRRLAWRNRKACTNASPLNSIKERAGANALPPTQHAFSSDPPCCNLPPSNRHHLGSQLK